MKKARKLQRAIAKISLALASVLMIAVAAALFVNVLDRFIFKIGLMWVEVFARYGLIWSVFLASNVLIYNDALMRVDFLDNFLPAKFKNVREKIYTVIFLVMLTLLVIFGMQQAVAYIGVSVQGLPVDKFWIYLCIPVGAFLMLLQYVLNLFIPAEVRKELDGGEAL